MTQKELLTFLRRCTTLANRDDHYKGYNRDKTLNKLTNTKKQTQEEETLVHVISVLNITRYATQVNRLKINEVINALQKANQDMNILLNITDVLTQCLRYHQIYTYACIIYTYLRVCPKYMK